MRNKSQNFDPGQLIASWTAFDYHPHKRGKIWYAVFCFIVLGAVVWSVVSDPVWGWFPAITILLSVAVYCYVHKQGEAEHDISLFEFGMFVDQQFVSWEDILGYWFVYDETASIIYFQKRGSGDQKIALQMGKETPEFFRYHFESIGITELLDQKESGFDIWIRALKL